MSDSAEPVAPPPPSSSTAEPAAAAASPADDAAAKRAARKARILGKGTDRLNRITQTGRGQEAAELYPASPPPLASPRAAPSSSAAAPADDDGEPPEIDISSLRAMQRADAPPFPGMPEGGSGMPAFPGMPEGMELPPQMQQMFSQLQSMMGGAGGASAADGASPFGASPFGGIPGAEDFAASKTDRIFAVVRALLCAAFGGYLVLPLLHAHKAASATESLIAHVNGGAMMHWARLGYERPSPWDAGMYGVEQLGLGGIVSAA
jgi:hypothetical protein